MMQFSVISNQNYKKYVQQIQLQQNRFKNSQSYSQVQKPGVYRQPKQYELRATILSAHPSSPSKALQRFRSIFSFEGVPSSTTDNPNKGPVAGALLYVVTYALGITLSMAQIESALAVIMFCLAVIAIGLKDIYQHDKMGAYMLPLILLNKTLAVEGFKLAPRIEILVGAFAGELCELLPFFPRLLWLATMILSLQGGYGCTWYVCAMALISLQTAVATARGGRVALGVTALVGVCVFAVLSGSVRQLSFCMFLGDAIGAMVRTCKTLFKWFVVMYLAGG